MKTQHTPGPWHLSQDEEEQGLFYITVGPNSVAVCREQDGSSEANARLIAAAPELLEACQAALKANPYGVRINGKWGDWRDVLEAAILKATQPN